MARLLDRGPRRLKLCWVSHRGTLTPVRLISLSATRREVAGGDVVVEDHHDGGHDAVVVQGPIRAAIVTDRTAGRSHSRGKGCALPSRFMTPKASGRTE